jgi:hypothetical protein
MLLPKEDALRLRSFFLRGGFRTLLSLSLDDAAVVRASASKLLRQLAVSNGTQLVKTGKRKRGFDEVGSAMWKASSTSRRGFAFLMGALGGIEVLAASLQKSFQNTRRTIPDCQRCESILDLLCCLTFKCAENGQLLAEAGGIPLLLQVISSCCTPRGQHATDLDTSDIELANERLLSMAMATLMNATDGSSKAKKMAKENGIIDAIKAILGNPVFAQSQEEDFPAIHHTLGAIMNLSHDEDLRVHMMSDSHLLKLVVPFMSFSFTPARYYATSVVVSLTISGRPRPGTNEQEWELAVCPESEAILESMGALDRTFFNAKVMDPLEQFDLALSLRNYARLLNQLPLDCACVSWTLWTLCHILASGDAGARNVLGDVGVAPLERIAKQDVAEAVGEDAARTTYVPRAMQAQQLAQLALKQLNQFISKQAAA